MTRRHRPTSASRTYVLAQRVAVPVPCPSTSVGLRRGGGPGRPTWVAASDTLDAAWVILKDHVDGGAWQHATLAGSGHLAPADAVVDLPDVRGLGRFQAHVAAGGREGSVGGSAARLRVSSRWAARASHGRQGSRAQGRSGRRSRRRGRTQPFWTASTGRCEWVHSRRRGDRSAMLGRGTPERWR